MEFVSLIAEIEPASRIGVKHLDESVAGEIAVGKVPLDPAHRIDRLAQNCPCKWTSAMPIRGNTAAKNLSRAIQCGRHTAGPPSPRR